MNPASIDVLAVAVVGLVDGMLMAALVFVLSGKPSAS